MRAGRSLPARVVTLIDQIHFSFTLGVCLEAVNVTLKTGAARAASGSTSAAMQSAASRSLTPQMLFLSGLGGERRGDLRAQLVRTRRNDAGTPLEVERRLSERRALGEVDRQAAFPHEQLSRGNVDRAGRLQRADRVHSPIGEVAERDRERAEYAQSVDEPDERWRVPRDEIGAGRL